MGVETKEAKRTAAKFRIASEQVTGQIFHRDCD